MIVAGPSAAERFRPDDLEAGGLSAGHAKILAGLERAEEIIGWAGAVKENGWSVRELEDRVRKGRPRAVRRAAVPRRDPHLVAAEEKLRERLCTRVQIVPRGAKGRIVIEYHSEEELQRLYEVLTGAPAVT